MTDSNDSGRPRSRGTSLGLAVLAALWLMPGGLALAATISVTTVADENGSGPNCSLREAIASANVDADVGGCAGVGAYGADTIVFGPTLSLPAAITLTDPAGALTVSSDVTITGPGATQLAIDGNHTTRVFSISTGQVMMSDLTIQNGNSNEGGNSAYYGGGISNSGTLLLRNCALSSNSAGLGGGIVNDGTLTLTNCTLTSNSAVGGGGFVTDIGGGILNYGPLTLTNCTLSGNSAANGGGGIANDGGMVTLTNCTLSGNSAGFGGGAILNGGSSLDSVLTVTNCTLSGNSADGFFGGGILNNGGLMTLRNTIVANSPSGGDCTNNGISKPRPSLFRYFA